MSRLLVLTIVLVFGLVDAKFPIDPKPCKHGDGDCIRDILNFILEHKTHGYKSLNLPEIDPLKISTINIKQGDESPVNIDLEFHNPELSGLRESRVTSLSGFVEDITHHNEVHLHAPIITLAGEYKVNGKVLILPVHGHGESNITLINSDLAIFFSGTPEEKAGGTYFKVKDIHLTVKPKRVFYNFANLFKGDQALSDNFNSFINENWEDIFHELRVSISNVFSQVLRSIIDNVFQKHPYDEFFA